MSYTAQLDKRRADIAEPFTSADVRKLRNDSEIQVVQASRPIRPATWRTLDRDFFQDRPEVQLRLYGFYSNDCDLRFCTDLQFVESFAADCLQDATGVEAISDIPRLKALSLGVFSLQSFDVLRDVNAELETLQLGATRSKRPDLAPLERFQNLRTLFVEGHRKNIDTVSTLSLLEDITLRSVATPDLEYISDLSRLWSVDIKLGGIRDLAALAKLPQLKHLEVWQVRGLERVDVVSRLRTLQNLFLQSLPQVRALPDLSACSSLRRVVLQNMKGLRDFSPLRSAPALEDFLLIQGEKYAPEDLLPVLENPCLRRVAGHFGSEKRGLALDELAADHGKEKFVWSEFEYR